MKKLIWYIFWILILLFFTKIDYRLTQEIYCCSDDFDYFSHAETLIEDFDLDYSNQLEGAENLRFNNDGKIAPIGFIGSGLLSSPFMFLGNLLDRFMNAGSVTNFKLTLYSLSSIFYLALSFSILIKSFDILKIQHNKIVSFFLFFGSGITYYSFERYSMTHVYEIFTISLIIYTSSRFYKNLSNRSIDVFYICFSLFLAYQVKWTNYFIFLIPLIIKEIARSDKKLFKNNIFIVYSSFFVAINSIISYLIYGSVVYNPFKIYNENLSVANYLTTNTSPGGDFKFEILVHIRNFSNILITQEFGILYFTPIVFFGFCISLYIFIFKYRSQAKLGLLSLATHGYILLLITAWKTPASSYGFRYLLCLVPISLLLFNYIFKKIDNRIFIIFFICLGVFSIMSTLFFETTPQTQLSLDEKLNSFGVMSRYTQENYLTGYLGALLNFNSYLIIFSTSFLGLYSFKFLVSTLGYEGLINTMNSLGLPTDNEDFINLLNKVEEINLNYFLVVILFIYSVVKMSIYKDKK